MIAINAAPAPELPAPADCTAAPSAAEQASEGRPVAFALLLGLALDATGAPAGSGKNPGNNGVTDTESIAAEIVATPARADAPAPIVPPFTLQPPAAPPAAAPNASPQRRAEAALTLASASGMAAKDAPAEPPAIATLPAGHAQIDAQAAQEPLPQPSLAAPAPELQKSADAVSATPPTHAAPAHPHAEAVPATLRAAPHVQAPEFPREFSTQVHIAVQRGVEQASIQVHPPELGPVEVHLEIGNGEARLHFAAESAATRDAITDAMPKLRELLGSQGLSLTGTSVGAEMTGREHAAAARHGHPAPGTDRAAGAATPEAAHVARNTLRLVDVFV